MKQVLSLWAKWSSWGCVIYPRLQNRYLEIAGFEVELIWQNPRFLHPRVLGSSMTPFTDRASPEGDPIWKWRAHQASGSSLCHHSSRARLQEESISFQLSPSFPQKAQGDIISPEGSFKMGDIFKSKHGAPPFPKHLAPYYVLYMLQLIHPLHSLYAAGAQFPHCR